MNLYIVCEDILSRNVVHKIFKEHSKKEIEYIFMGERGNGYIRKKINEFNDSRNNLLFFILTDLDSEKCAPLLIQKWLKHPIRKNLIFRVAVREIEAWLLADREGISEFLSLNYDYVKKEIQNPDSLDDPKEKLIFLTEKSNRRHIKSDIIRQQDNKIIPGPAYYARLSEFVSKHWNITRANKNSESLLRTVKAISDFLANL